MSLLISLTLIVTLVRSQTETSLPNVIVIDVDDLPFLQQWKDYAPTGMELEGVSISLSSYPTPNIQKLIGESVVFSRAYCGGPKCSPSRYSLLTGRQPARCEEAVRKTLEYSSGMWGPMISVPFTRIADDDKRYNLPTLLKNHRDTPYYTGHVGKWHLMGDEDDEAHLCDELDTTPNATKYALCASKIAEVGFDFVDALYVGNVYDNEYFSHNPEWMVSQAQRFIDTAVNVEQRPFFLYFATTLSHSITGQDAQQSLLDYTTSMTPKGVLQGDEVPTDVSMKSRTEMWKAAMDQSKGNFQQAYLAALTMWADDAIGALMGFLEDRRLRDDTVVVLMGDHGVKAKGTMYEQGSRILMMMRYPALFGDKKVTMPQEFIVSAVDIAPTVLEIVDKKLPTNYVMDGRSFLDGVLGYIASDGAELDDSCCSRRTLDIIHSHSMVTAQFQYFYRATDDVEDSSGQDLLYPHSHDTEQLYDLDADPNQKVNLMANLSDATLATTILEFQSAMREYIADLCPSPRKECVMPALRCWDDSECTVMGEICHDGECCVSGESGYEMCFGDDDCAEGEYCDRRVCALSGDCTMDEHCSGAQLCVDFGCKLPCETDDDCEGKKRERECDVMGYCEFVEDETVELSELIHVEEHTTSVMETRTILLIVSAVILALIVRTAMQHRNEKFDDGYDLVSESPNVEDGYGSTTARS